MNNENYQLRYLPLFFDDVNNITLEIIYPILRQLKI